MSLIKKWIITTLKGAEQTLAQELKEFGTQPKIEQGFCIVKCREEKLAEIAYMSQASENIYELVSISDKDQKEIPVEFSKKVGISAPKIIGEDHFKKSTLLKLESNRLVRYSSQNKSIIISSNEKVYWGKSILKENNSKRDYKIFISPNTLHPIIAYALVRKFLKRDSNQSIRIFDPFVHDGTILIETALFISNKPHNYYRKNLFSNLLDETLVQKPNNSASIQDSVSMQNDAMKNNILARDRIERILANLDAKIIKPKQIRAELIASDTNSSGIAYARKNAKIAGVNKLIRFSKKELDWIDLEFFDKPIDIIVSQPRKYTHRLKRFYQNLKNTLSDNGRIFYACEKLDHPIETLGFKKKSIGEIQQGKRPIVLWEISKK